VLPPLDIRHDPDARRYTAEVDGHTATLDYHTLDAGTVDFASTYVPEALRGRRVGTRLVLHALADAGRRGWRVRASCWFVPVVVQAHPEARHLLEA